MKHLGTGIAVGLLCIAAPAMAAMSGTISTDRFGYSGTITRYNSLADAQAGVNETDTVSVSDRDLALYVDDSYNVVMGSWWYTTSANGPGWGNTHGNTGVGFTQLYDADASSTVTKDMSFSNFTGGYWTEFNLSLTGANAGAADGSRLSVYDNVNDGGILHSYDLSLTATGLEGVENGNTIEATNHATGVSGTYSGVFELTENQTSGANIGYYTFDFSLNMDNWAFANQASLQGDGFSDSYFAVTVVPAPGAALLGLLGLGFIRKVKQA